MTVNAIAHEMKKKVLLVDFGGLTGRRSEAGSDMDADLRGLFREAQMSNAVLFFDECEVVFRSRNQGGDRMLNSLLTEIERHEGMVFLATNRPYELDEAMHRRITCVLEYRPPDHTMRQKIWENLLGTTTEVKRGDNNNNDDDNDNDNNNKNKEFKKSLECSSDVDIAALAIKYELTGGFIKNAVLSALLSAISRNKDQPVLTQADLVAGCRLQMRGSLTQRIFEDKVVPMYGCDELVLSSQLKESIDAILRFEKARARVYGSWSSVHSSFSGGGGAGGIVANCYSSDSNDSGSQRACIVAFAGPIGSGKKTLMKAIAMDLGRGVKLVHVAELMIGSVAETIQSMQALIQDARLSDSLVAIDGFENVLDEGGAGENGWRLQLLLSRLLGIVLSSSLLSLSLLSLSLGVLRVFPGCVILLCNIDNPQNIMLQRYHHYHYHYHYHHYHH